MKTKKWVTTALMSLVVLSAIGLSGCGNSSAKSSADKDKTTQSSKKTTKKAAKKTYKLGKGTLTYGKNAVSSDSSSENTDPDKGPVKGDVGEYNHDNDQGDGTDSDSDDDSNSTSTYSYDSQDEDSDTSSDSVDNQSDSNDATPLKDGYYRWSDGTIVNSKSETLILLGTTAERIANNSHAYTSVKKSLGAKGYTFETDNVAENGGGVDVVFVAQSGTGVTNMTCHVDPKGTLTFTSIDGQQTTENWFDEGLYK